MRVNRSIFTVKLVSSLAAAWRGVTLLFGLAVAVPQAYALTAQTITGFAPATPITYSTGKTFALTATGGGSGNPVIFTSATTTVCTVAATTATVVTVGTCTLRANQAGNATYSAAPQVSANVVINKGSQTITFGTLATKTLNQSPVTISAIASSGLTVVFTSTTTTVCTVSGVSVTLIKVGTCTIASNQAGNTNFNAAPQVTQSFAITAPLAQTITGFAPATPRSYSPGLTFALSATGGASGNPVTFSSTTLTVCTVASTTATVLTAGTCTLKANQAGNANYNAAPQVSANVVVNKATQTISFGTLAPKTLNLSPVTIGATASSGLTVTFTSTTTPVCTVSGTSVTLVTVGTCTIAANQAGNTSYNAATQITQSFAVTALIAQTITAFAPATPITYSTGLAFALTATGGASGNPVLFASTTGTVCTVAGTTATVVTAGTCTLTANQAGNATYAAAPQVTKSVVINKASQTITFNALPNVTTSASPLALSATASSALPVAFTSSTPTICTVSGTNATLLAGGTCTINANQAGNTSYSAATQVVRSFAVTALPPQAITDFSLPTPVVFSTGMTIGLSATGGASGNPVTFSTTTGAVCTVTGEIVTVLTVGTCIVKADQAGNASFSPAPQVTASMAITKASQTINFGNLPGVPISSSPVTLYAEATSELPVTFTSSTTSICTVAAATVTLLQTGTCTIRANQAGNANFNAAAQVSRSFTVQPPVLTAKITSPIAGAMYTAPADISIAVATTVAPGQSVTWIHYYSNGYWIGSGPPGEPYLLTGLAARTYHLFVIANDTAGNSAYAANEIAVTVAPPAQPVTVAISAPATGTNYLAPATIAIAATASAIAPATSISRVDFYDGNTLLGSSTTAPFAYTWTGAPVGRHALTASATDNRGATGFSAVVYAVVDGGDSCDATPPLTANELATKVALLDQLPITFETNIGQTNPEVRFQARGPGYLFYLTERERVMVLQAPWASTRLRNHSGDPAASTTARSAAVRFSFVDANPHPQISADGPVAQRSNYLTGAEPGQWHTDVNHFAQARYHDLYPGIDEVYSGRGGRLEFDLHIAPGAKPEVLRLAINGTDRLVLDQSGDLLLPTALGTLVQMKPVAYQMIAGERREVAAAYAIVAANEVKFALGAYDPAYELVIDPVLVYSTLLGGHAAGTVANGIAVSRCGEAYIVGGTDALDFPTTPTSFDPVGNPFAGVHMAFVAKLNPSATGLIYSTYLTGTTSGAATEAVAVALDATGHAYVAGNTMAADFPTTAGSVFPTAAGGGFVAKLNNAGNGLVYSTYLGAPYIEGLAVDSAGAAYVASDGFVTKVNPGGTALDYAFTLGGYGTSAQAIAVDLAGNAYVAGVTNIVDFPVTAGAFQTALPGTTDAGFVSKIDPTGTSRVYSTYLGATTSTEIFGLAIDAAGNAFVAGRLQTGGTIPNYTGPSPLFNLSIDQPFNQYAFVAQLNPAGSQLAALVRLGGSHCSGTLCSWATTWANAIALDRNGNAWITGPTTSNQLPLVKPLVAQFSSIPGPDIFVARLATGSSSLMFSTLLGGQAEIGASNNNFVMTAAGLALAVDSIGSAYVAGVTNRSGFPTTPGVVQATLAAGSGYGAFVVKINDSKDTSLALAVDPPIGAVGAPVLLTATIAGNSPTGSATFFDGASELATAPIMGSAGQFTATTSAQFAGGSHSLRAVYAGDAHNNGSVSTVVTLSVTNPGGYPTIALTGIGDGTTLVANSGATYVGARLVISAQAAAGNLIKDVHVYLDGNYLVAWILTGPTFTYDYYTLSALLSGVHTLYATTTDNFNHTTVSAPVRFVVNRPAATAPTIAITAPGNGASVTSPVTFTATATATAGNTISSVSYYQGPTLLGGAVVAPYAFTWTNIPAGTYSIVAAAVDNAGASNLSAPISITISPPPPGPPGAPTLINAIPGTNSAALTFTAPASDGGAAISGYTASCSTAGQSPASAAGVPPATSVVVAGLAGGVSYGCTVRAANSLGTGPASNSVNVTPLTAPIVSITAPTNGAGFLAPATIELTASASSTMGAVVQVEFFSGTTPLGTATVSPYKFAWSNVPLGSYALAARATTTLGSTATSSVINITVDPMDISITNPADGATIFDTATIVTGKFTGEPPTSLTVNGMPARLGNSTFAASVPVQTGTNTLTVVATTAVGTATRTVTVFGATPAIAVTNIAPGDTVDDDSMTVRGTLLAPDNSAVIVNGHLANIGVDGTFALNNLPLVAGTNTLTLTLNTPNGTQQMTMPVASSGPAPFTFEVSPSTGFAPLTVTLTLTNRASAVYNQLGVDTDGNGTTDYSEAGAPIPIAGRNFTVDYPSPGSYPLKITLLDDLGHEVYAATRVVQVMSQSTFDYRLRGLWAGMTGALAAGDTTAALRYFTANARQKYSAAFDALLPAMPDIVESFSAILPTGAPSTIAEYALVRKESGVNRLHFIYFGQDFDGVWRIDGM